MVTTENRTSPFQLIPERSIWRLGAGVGLIAIEIIAELGPEHARIHALENGDNSFERNFADVLVMPDSLLQFSRGGKKEDVRRSYAINSSDEGDRDSAAHFVNLVTVRTGRCAPALVSDDNGSDHRRARFAALQQHQFEF